MTLADRVAALAAEYRSFLRDEIAAVDERLARIASDPARVEDDDAVRETAHRIRGAAASFGFDALAAAARTADLVFAPASGACATSRRLAAASLSASLSDAVASGRG